MSDVATWIERESATKWVLRFDNTEIPVSSTGLDRLFVPADRDWILAMPVGASWPTRLTGLELVNRIDPPGEQNAPDVPLDRYRSTERAYRETHGDGEGE